jgi:hypothetical protein
MAYRVLWPVMCVQPLGSKPSGSLPSGLGFQPNRTYPGRVQSSAPGTWAQVPVANARLTGVWQVPSLASKPRICASGHPIDTQPSGATSFAFATAALPKVSAKAPRPAIANPASLLLVLMVVTGASIARNVTMKATRNTGKPRRELAHQSLFILTTPTWNAAPYARAVKTGISPVFTARAYGAAWKWGRNVRGDCHRGPRGPQPNSPQTNWATVLPDTLALRNAGSRSTRSQIGNKEPPVRFGGMREQTARRGSLKDGPHSRDFGPDFGSGYGPARRKRAAVIATRIVATSIWVRSTSQKLSV